jgi:hypothetical protein
MVALIAFLSALNGKATPLKDPLLTAMLGVSMRPGGGNLARLEVATACQKAG